jgi:threonyl-tRNA synthetase
MHGLFRVRGFTQDDAHIFCLPHQIAGEIKGVLDLVEEVLTTFGFSQYEVSVVLPVAGTMCAAGSDVF